MVKIKTSERRDRMSINLLRIFLLTSWTSVFMLPNKSIKRFLPVTTFCTLILATVNFIGAHYHFFEAKGNSKSKIINILSLILGFFSVGTFWTFKLTYGNFPRYLLMNLVQNVLFAFPIITFLEKTQYLIYKKFNRYHHLALSMTMALILYAYQLFIDEP